MNRSLSSALLAGVLAAGCAATKVDPPPPPPALRAPVEGSPANANTAFRAPASSEPVKPPETAPAPVPAPRESPPPVQTSTAAQTSPAAQSAAASAAPAGTPEKGAPAAPQLPKPEAPPLGWIAGQPLSAEELLLEWGDIASRELWMVIDKLVATRLAMSEASRLGIRLAPEAVEQRYSSERAKLEKRIARGDKPPELEKYIERELGFEPGRYLERVRRATIRQMLAERAVRAASLASESVALRLIVVPGEAEKEKVAAALLAGRTFADVAEEFSVDDSKKVGGLVPFVVRDERSPLSELAFQTPVGEVAGPLPISDHLFWIRVEEKRAPLAGDWAAIEGAVEASLATTPVENTEFVHWRLTMEGRYPIDLGPLWSLIGAAK